MNLRKHQQAAVDVADKIVTRVRDNKTTLAWVTPGGGKTLLASLFAHALIKGSDVDHVLVICPRDSLRAQMRGGFAVPELGLHGGLQIGHGGQRAIFSGERLGYVTTYQEVLANPKRWPRVMKKDRWLVVFDESHHLPKGRSDEEDMAWTRAVTPIFDMAKRVLLMTGTMQREKKEQLAFVTYSEDRDPLVDIRYTRRDALDEQAILNVSVKLCDGKAAYWHKFSKHEHVISKVSAAEESRALRTLLDDDGYRNSMLKDAIDEWAKYRDVHNPRARMIVVCDVVANCRKVAKFIREQTSWLPVLAVSSEKGSHKALARFRDNHEGDILVTCQMAYEGLDVPDCTHLVCLTNFRARSWLEQAFSRITRFDRSANLSWDDQCAFLYVPNDPSMISFVNEWIVEQDGRYDDAPEMGVVVGPRPKRSTFNPESGELTGYRFADTLGVFGEADQRRVSLFRSKYPEFASTQTVHVLKLARDLWPNDAEFSGAAE